MTRVVALIQNMDCMDPKLVSVLAHYWCVEINTWVTVLSCSATGSTKRWQPGCQTRHFCISREQANVIFLTSFKKIMHTNWLCFPVVSIDHVNITLRKEFISNLSSGRDIRAVIRWWVIIGPRVVLCRVWIFSLCLCGFFLYLLHPMTAGISSSRSLQPRVQEQVGIGSKRM